MFNKKEYYKKWRAKNKEKVINDHRKWYLDNKEYLNKKNREYFKKYRLLNKDKLYIKNRLFFEKDNGLYKTFRCMFNRCLNKNNKSYKNYGGRGIKLLWNNYEDFKKDMYKSYMYHLKKYGRKDTTIERKDNNGNYYKENCCWATRREQNKNKRY